MIFTHLNYYRNNKIQTGPLIYIAQWFEIVPAYRKSTEWGCHEGVAWSRCCLCRTPRPMYPAQLLLHQMPIEIKGRIIILYNIWKVQRIHNFEFGTKFYSWYLFGKATSSVWRVQNLIVKDREIESQSKSNWVCWGKFTVCNVLKKFIIMKKLMKMTLNLCKDSQ